MCLDHHGRPEPEDRAGGGGPGPQRHWWQVWGQNGLTLMSLCGDLDGRANVVSNIVRVGTRNFCRVLISWLLWWSPAEQDRQRLAPGSYDGHQQETLSLHLVTQLEIFIFLLSARIFCTACWHWPCEWVSVQCMMVVSCCHHTPHTPPAACYMLSANTACLISISVVFKNLSTIKIKMSLNTLLKSLSLKINP